jgi:DNA-binding transcriptional LysR family regulator
VFYSIKRNTPLNLCTVKELTKTLVFLLTLYQFTYRFNSVRINSLIDFCPQSALGPPDRTYLGGPFVLVESLKVFCDLVETQSFSKTAVLNSVTQSAVSQQLKSIEKRQGKQLLEREKRRLTLTAEGEIFYRYAREIVRRFEEMQHRIQALGGVVSGTVRLAAIYSVGMLELAPHLKSYIKAYPKVNLRLQYDQAQRIYDNVASSEIDLGIVAYPKPQRNVDVLKFTEDDMVVVSNPDSDLTKNANIDPKVLEEFPLILFTPETPTRRAIDRFLRKHSVRPNVVMELDHIATIKHAVEVDIGVSILPKLSVQYEQSWGTLTATPFNNDTFARPVGIIYRKGRSFSLATQKLIEILSNGTPEPIPESNEATSAAAAS